MAHRIITPASFEAGDLMQRANFMALPKSVRESDRAEFFERGLCIGETLRGVDGEYYYLIQRCEWTLIDINQRITELKAAGAIR